MPNPLFAQQALADPGELTEEGYRTPRNLTDVMINSFLAQAGQEGMSRENIPPRAWEIAKAERHQGPNRQPLREDLRDAEHYLWAMEQARGGRGKSLPYSSGLLPAMYNVAKIPRYMAGRTSRPSVDAVLYGMMGGSAGQQYYSQAPKERNVYDGILKALYR